MHNHTEANEHTKNYENQDDSEGEAGGHTEYYESQDDREAEGG